MPFSLPDGAEVVLGFDGSFNGDTTALVAVTVDRERPHVELVVLWQPASGQQVPIVFVEDAIRAACRFAESVELSLEWRLGVLWLLFVPRTWVSGLPLSDRPKGPQGDPASAWRKERWVNRRNEKWAAIIDAWAKSMAPADRTEVPVLPAGLIERDLIGGRFVLSNITAYSRQAK